MRGSVRVAGSGSPWRQRVGGALLACVLLAAGCGDDGGSDAGEAGRESGEAVVGGVLTVAEFAQANSLDPIVAYGAGVYGMTEMAAIYDTIMRWNPETREYEEHIAESLEHSADFTEWTLKIKPGIKFSDGTPYDADAVVFGMSRHRSGLPGAPPCEEMFACPANNTTTAVYMSFVKSMEAVDDLTVKFTLTEPYTAFPYVLSGEVSMIPSPTAMRSMCASAASATDCDFSLNPVGAGPFKIDKFAPGEEITMVRNEDYWGGQVYLDGLRFLDPGDAGGDLSWEGFGAGSYDVAFLRTPTSTHAAKEANANSYSAIQYGGSIVLANMGVAVECSGGQPAPLCTGTPDGPTATAPPTTSLKVRKAIAAALDPVVINERAYDGLGIADSSLFQDTFPWDPGVPGPQYDPEEARRLADEAKAEGWDGTVRFINDNSPASRAVGIAVETMLEAVGIEAQVDTSKPLGDRVQAVVIDKDFDLAGWGLAISSDDGNMAAIAQNFGSTSPGNRVGFKSKAVDDALRDLRAAETDDQKREAFRIIETEIRDEVPVIPFGAVEERIVWADDVHGIVFTHSTAMLFDKAYKS